MRAGQLRHFVRVMQRAPGRDAAGQPFVGSELVGEMWADVRHPNGLEEIRSDSLVSEVKASIRVRARPDLVIRSDMWVEFGDRIYDVKAVLPDATDRRYLDLSCVMGARRA